MDLCIAKPNLAFWGNREFRCVIGSGGFVSAETKREGDGGTPIGRWKMREVLYRPDREAAPATILPLREVGECDGWCDCPEDPNYNQLIQHPYAASAERLWRDDHLYDIVVVLGFNDSPVVPGKGSAIFMHFCRPDFSPSAGCIHLERDDLLTILREADSDSAVLVSPL